MQSLAWICLDSSCFLPLSADSVRSVSLLHVSNSGMRHFQKLNSLAVLNSHDQLQLQSCHRGASHWQHLSKSVARQFHRQSCLTSSALPAKLASMMAPQLNHPIQTQASKTSNFFQAICPWLQGNESQLLCAWEHPVHLRYVPDRLPDFHLVCTACLIFAHH